MFKSTGVLKRLGRQLASKRTYLSIGSNYSVSMNTSGNRVAVGYPYGSTNNRGFVRIYSNNTQLGSDIIGEADGDQFGYSVSLNSAGDRVAVGAPYNDGTSGTDRGSVRVYSWNGSAWTKLGADIDGEAASDNSGWSVSLNSAGDRLAIGAVGNDGNGNLSGHVRVYSWNGSAWTQLGADINGEAAGDQSGYSVSLNSAGDRIAIGAPYNDGNGSDSGHVRVYSWNGSTWTQLGADIDGEAAGDNSGWSVSLNSAGDRLAIGAPYNDGNGIDSGHVRVYSWNGSAWTQLGTDINGVAGGDGASITGDLFGRSVSLNSAGDRVAIGAPYYGNNGHVRVYSWNGLEWKQIITDINGVASGYLAGWGVSINGDGNKVAVSGNNGDLQVYDITDYIVTKLGADIDGEATGDNSGYSVAINSVGDRIAIGAPYNDGNGSDSGHVRVYSWNGSAWRQLGTDIDGEAASDYSGWSISLNSAGNVLAIGAVGNDGNGNGSGHVRVYEYSNNWWRGVDVDGEAAGDQSGYSVSLNSAGDRLVVGANFNDGNGNNSGHVRVYYPYYSMNGTAWAQLGADIDGEAAGDTSGYSVDINSAGDIIAVGANFNDGNGIDSGHVRVYSWNGSAWTQLGTDINGEAASDNSGWSVSLNSAGDRLAVGAINNSSARGHVRVYSWNGSAWTQLGTDIDGEAAGDQSGYSVSLNSAGDRLAVGANLNAPDIRSGNVCVYSWNGSAWTKVTSIDGEQSITGDQFGFSVSLNSDGDRLVVGARYNDGTNLLSTDNRGSVRVYSIQNI